MKKLIAIFLSVFLVFQICFISFAFSDTVANNYTGKIYNHDDKFANYEIINGIDISYYQGTVDFDKLQADGVDFLILRAGYRGNTYGNLVADTNFATYANEAIKRNIDIGAYIYSQAITVQEAKDEAAFILDIVKGYDITLPIVFDFEYAGAGTRLKDAKLTNEQRTDICNAFCEDVENSGYTAMIYANQSMLVDDLNDDELAKKYDIWLANFSTSPKYAGLMYDCEYTYWQYSSTGRVDGISGNVDCNFRYFKKPLKPTNLTVESETGEYTTLTWDKVKGCYGYQIYKYDSTTQKYKKIGETVGAATCSFSDKNSAGAPNSYKVRAKSAYKGGFKAGSFSNVVTTKGILKLTLKNKKTGSATLNFEPVNNVLNYFVLRCDTADGTYEQIAELGANATSYTDKTDDGFKTYHYMLKAAVKEQEGEGFYYIYSPVLTVEKAQPQIKSVKLASGKSITVSWKNRAYTSGVEIWRKKGDGEFLKYKTVSQTTTSFTNEKLSRGVTFSYKIRQFITKNGKTYYSEFTDELSATTLKASKIITLKPNKKSVTVKFEKAPGASGYEIYYKNAYMKKYALAKDTSLNSYKMTGLSRYSNYSFKIRVYAKVGNKKVYGPYSKAMNTKTL